MSDEDKGAGNAWHLDKKVPIALIAAVICQTAIAGWAMSKFDSRLGQVEEKLAREEASTKDAEREAKDIFARLVRVEERSLAILEGVRRLETRLDAFGRRSETAPPTMNGARTDDPRFAR